MGEVPYHYVVYIKEVIIELNYRNNISCNKYLHNYYSAHELLCETNGTVGDKRPKQGNSKKKCPIRKDQLYPKNKLKFNQ